MYMNFREDSNILLDWLRATKQSINLEKSTLYFSLRKEMIIYVYFCIIVDGIPIEQVNHYKFLGLVIDEESSWKEQVNKFVIKLKSSNYILSNTKNNSTKTKFNKFISRLIIG